MPHPAFWSCRTCSATLGQVSKDGSLRVQPDVVVTVPRVGEHGLAVVVVTCPCCHQPRSWSPRPPGYEVKAG